jgi:hypothetical protein
MDFSAGACFGPGKPVQVDRQHLSYWRAVEIALPERFGPAEHQESAASLGDKTPNQLHLVMREKSRLNVVQDYRVIAEQIFGLFGKSVAKFCLITCAKPHEDRLIVLLGLLGVLVIESAVQRIVDFAGVSPPLVFWLASGDTKQSHELYLFVLAPAGGTCIPSSACR